MTKYIHYNADTRRFIGFFDSDITPSVPEPNVKISDKQHELFYNAIIANKSITVGSITILPYEPIVIKLDWEDIRRKRDDLLAQSDWTQLSDVPNDLKLKYAEYRQALRDVPSSYKSPGDVIWPAKPS